MRKPEVHFNRIMQRLFITVIMAVIYNGLSLVNPDQATIQNTNGMLISILADNSFPYVYAGVSLLPKVVPLTKRETHNGIYRPIAYILSQCLAYWPVFFIETVAVVGIMSITVDLNQGVIGYFYIIAAAYLNCLSSFAYGTLIGLLFANGVNASTTLGVTNVVLLCMTGLYMNAETMAPWISWIKWISWFYYGFSILAKYFWQNVTYISCSLSNTSCTKDGIGVIHNLGIPLNDSVIPTYFGLLVATVAVNNIFAFVLFKRRLNLTQG